ncbi:MAG: radical SAM protein [Vicinamibacterales bacterium]
MWKAHRPYAPLGSLYAASYARQAGYQVRFFDAMLARSEAEWADALDRERPAVAMLYEDSFNYLTKMCLHRMREAALEMIAAATRRGIPIVVAGSDATDHPSIYLEHGARAVIAGEGEVTLVDVVGALRRGTADLSSIPGLVVLRDGRTVRTPPRAVMRDLSVLPRPAWDLVDVERYRAVWQAHHGHFSMNITTTRGCPYHCNWCAKPIYGQRYTARPADDVAEEIAWLKATYRPDHLWITDDIFGLKPGWIEAFAAALVTRAAVTPFKCLMRADNVTPAVVGALRIAGCRAVWLGAESGSQRVLDAMEKGTRVEQIESASTLLHDAGIDVGFFLQFGYPGETIADIELTLAMVRRCRPDDIGISVSYPLPGTPFHDRVRAQLGAKQTWHDSADLAVMYRATYSPAFYRTLHALTHARFRFDRALDAWTHGYACGRLTRAELRTIGAGAVSLLKLPTLSWRVKRQARQCHTGSPTAPIVPLLSQPAAALPSEQQP